MLARGTSRHPCRSINPLYFVDLPLFIRNEITMDVKQWAKLQESLLKSQLKVIREFLREDQPPRFHPRRKGRSQMSIVYDVLLAANQPLRVTEILSRAKTNFNIELERESVVSALTDLAGAQSVNG